MEDNKFQKDRADTNVNVTKLDAIFNVNTDTGEIFKNDSDNIYDSALTEVTELRNELKQIGSSLPDIDNIIFSNIERANRFLDIVEDQIIRGNISASMIESCATLINAVTTAATSITGISYNNNILDIKREELRIREKKLTIDNIANGAKEVHITNNNLTMTREQLLSELRSAKKS